LTELLTSVNDKFFKSGKPVNSPVAMNAGDFKTCGAVMGMSILQGGPAPNFLAADIASWLEIHSALLKTKTLCLEEPLKQ